MSDNDFVILPTRFLFISWSDIYSLSNRRDLQLCELFPHFLSSNIQYCQLPK